MIRFRLRRAHSLRVVVRGPAPSCEIAGEFRARGRIGVNRLVFRGRIAHRALDAGTYTLTVLPLSGLNSIVVRVTKKGDAIPLRTLRKAKVSCTPATAAAAPASPLETFLTGAPALATLGVSPDSAPSGAVQAHATSVPVLEADIQDAPASEPKSLIPHLPRLLPQLGAGESHGVVPAIATLAFLATIALMLAVVANLVVRFLRGSWNP